MIAGQYTVFTSTVPLGKNYSLSQDGKLTKTTAGNMWAGSYQTVEFGSMAEFAGQLLALNNNQAISSSLPTNGKPCGPVVTERNLAGNVGAVARTKKHFGLPDVPGIALIDVDSPPSGEPLSQVELFELLKDICPDITGAGVIYWPSGSSLIYEGEKQHLGIRGQHLYVWVQSLADLQRAGTVLNQRLFLKGLGRIDISSSGAMLPRTVVDASVHQLARLIFSAGAVVSAPLEQRRPAPLILSEGPPLDSRQALPDLSAEEESRYSLTLETLKAKAEPQAQTVRAEWRIAHEKSAVKQAVDMGTDPAIARETVNRSLDAALCGTLTGSWQVIIVNDEGKEQSFTVDQILKDRTKFHLAKCLDPLNPGHRNRSADSILYLDQPQPIIYSLDDGGTVYKLLRATVRLPVIAGQKAQLAEQIAGIIADDPDLFIMAGRIVRITSGHTTALTAPLLRFLVGCRVSLYRQAKDKQTAAETDKDLLDMVMVLLPERLRVIVGRSTIPLIDTKGRVIDKPGHDQSSEIYLDLIPGEVQNAPLSPSRLQAVEALKRLWKPWSAYQWATPHDRAAMLATVLTVPLRPTIDAAPGLIADSPSQASGKSKAVGAVAVLARGFQGGAKTWVTNQEAELEKYCLSVARSADPAIILDNILGVFSSACIATTVAEGKVNARLLGVNDLKTPELRVMWLGSGNNISMGRDELTRFMIARINTGAENPAALSYKFDPVEVALQDRQGIICAAITLHRAYHIAGKPRADNINTRFSEWGKTIRQLVLWLHDSEIADAAGISTLGDPAFSILQTVSVSDPETESLALTLYALSEIFSGKPFTVNDAKREFDMGESGGDEARRNLHEGISGLLPGRSGKLSPQTLNWAFKHRRDRPAGGLKLELLAPSDQNRGAVWRVVPVQARQPS